MEHREQLVRTATRKGVFLGKSDERGNEVYKGIPYCLPPTGDRRWLPAQEIPDNDLEYEAFDFSPLPPQADAGPYAGMPQSEDCLYLNIWKNPGGSGPKAVLVWNHGGSYIKGGTRNPDFSGSLLVSQYPDIIFVSINHRLGLLANLNLSDLDPDGRYSCSNNLAQLDLHAALKWVHENIAAFGGDPERITVFGHSSGSSNISAQFLLADRERYFRRAVMHSSFAIDVGTTSLEQSLVVARRLFELLNHPTLEELLNMSAQELMSAQKALLATKFPPDVKPFSVVKDGTVIPEDAYFRLKNGSVKGTDCILGTACGEYDQQFRARESDEEKYAFLSSQIGSRADAGELVRQYAEHEPERPLATAYMDMKNDLWIRVPANLMAEALAEHNRVFMFYTEAENEETHVRAPHGNEYRAQFGNPDKGLYSEKTVESMRNMLANFVLAGTPFCDNAPTMTKMPDWPEYDAENRKTMIVGDCPRVDDGVRVRDMETLLPLYEEYGKDE